MKRKEIAANCFTIIFGLNALEKPPPAFKWKFSVSCSGSSLAVNAVHKVREGVIVLNSEEALKKVTNHRQQ